MWECNRDADCPGRQVCFSAALSWVSAQYGNVSYCDCTSELSFGGPNCDERLPSQDFVEFIFGFIIATSAVALAVCSLDLLRLVRFAKIGKQVLIQSLALVCVSFTLSTSQSAVELLCATDLTNFEIVLGQKTCMYASAQFLLLSFGLFVSYLAFSNVSVLWLEIAMRAKRLEHMKGTGRITKAIRVVQVLFVLCMIGAIISGNIIISIAILMPFCALLIVLYSVGGWMLLRVMQTSINQTVAQGSSETMTKILKRIFVAATTITSLLCLLLLAAILTAVLLAPSKHFATEPGGWDRPAYMSYLCSRFLAQTVLLAEAVYLDLCARGLKDRLEAEARTLSTPKTSAEGPTSPGQHASNRSPHVVNSVVAVTAAASTVE